MTNLSEFTAGLLSHYKMVTAPLLLLVTHSDNKIRRLVCSFCLCQLLKGCSRNVDVNSVVQDLGHLMRNVSLKIETETHGKIDMTAQCCRSPEKGLLMAEVGWKRDVQVARELTELTRTSEPS